MLESLTALIFPAHCVHCQTEGQWICADRRASLGPTPVDICRLCGKFGRHGLCQKCAAKTKLDGIVAPLSYHQPPIRQAIKAGKYTAQADVFKFLVRQYRLKLVRELPDANWTFAPVPLGRDHLTQRGFNQAQIIARTVAGQDFGCQALFKKVLITAPQASLDRAGRQQNLRHAFAALDRPMPEQLVICDDVITTGTTVSQLAKIAKRRGAKTVWALALAHG